MRKILVAIGSASEAIRIAPLLRRIQSLSPTDGQLPDAGVASLPVVALLMAVERVRSEDGLKARLAAALHFLDPHSAARRG